MYLLDHKLDFIPKSIASATLFHIDVHPNGFCLFYFWQPSDWGDEDPNTNVADIKS